jgi:hypothetical protein
MSKKDGPVPTLTKKRNSINIVTKIPGCFLYAALKLAPSSKSE